MKTKKFDDAFLDELKDAYDMEHRILKALPKLIGKVSHEELETALQDHLEQTENQVKRLEDVFEAIGEKPSRSTCLGIRGILEEGEKAIEKATDEHVREAVLIAGCQKVEHYEIATYGTLCSWAKSLDCESSVIEPLRKNLEEEKKADELLTKVAEKTVNPEAVETV